MQLAMTYRQIPQAAVKEVWTRLCLNCVFLRVTLGDGSKWLIHKGQNYGISSQTVVTPARHMSSDWKVNLHVLPKINLCHCRTLSNSSSLCLTSVQVVREGNFLGRKTVSDFVRTGGSNYDLLFDNCHWASIRMMDQ